MNVIEIRNLSKNYGTRQALSGLTITVPQGAVYGFIGENSSGKTTTEKLICGLIQPTSGTIRIFGKEQADPAARAKIGALIEAPGCFPELTVWENMKLQAANLGLKKTNAQIIRILKTVRMEGAASNKYKNCSLGMKQRIGIAMALLGNPELLILDEPINGLDADGMRIVREILQELSADGVTVLISSHILGELEKVATHYGIIRQGKILKEMTAQELENSCPTFTALKTGDKNQAQALLSGNYSRVEADDSGYLRVYDNVPPEEIVSFLYQNGLLVKEIFTAKIGLEEYYKNLMKEGN